MTESKKDGSWNMKTLTIKQLENQLNHNQGTTLFIKLEGIITTKIEIKNVEIKYDKNNIAIFNKKDETQNILLNKHQIMKIEEIIKKIYYIRFDFMQNVKIIVEN